MAGGCGKVPACRQAGALEFPLISIIVDFFLFVNKTRWCYNKFMVAYKKSLAEIYKELDCSSGGLTISEVKNRQKKFGKNRLGEIKKTPLVLKFFLQFKDLLVIILLIAALLALVAGEPRDALIILIIVFINAIIGFVQEYRAEQLLTALKKHLPSNSKVIRSGKTISIPTPDLVPGDILLVAAGDAIGADARLIESFDLKTNDFPLTGESELQPKRVHDITETKTLTEIDNMIFMGTSVAAGQAKAVVIATGMETEFGKIAKESQVVKEAPTPLQKEMTHTGKTVGKIAAVVALGSLGIFYFLLQRELHECVLFAIAAGAAVVPEGLPAAMSIALSLGANRMLKKNALVKKLLHVESLGSVTVICTDKTGTLTTGEMTIKEIYPKDLSGANKEMLYQTLALCNNATLDPKPLGEPIDLALLRFLLRQNPAALKIRDQKRIFEIPFSSDRKMMTVIYGKENQVAYTKGAVIEVLNCCNLGNDERKKILAQNDLYSKSGLKVLALADKKISPTGNFTEKNLEQDLEFLGLLALSDPPRPEVSLAIRTCKMAKIRVVMLTGDYDLTALQIAKEIGLADRSNSVVSGVDLHQMDDEKLKDILKIRTVFSRIEPMQKLRIVKCLQEMGEVVAVTGDGVNDVPALVKADIGVAMGRIGTDVAKEAADMILLDDNFATIVAAVREGRRIFDNAKKIVYYVFSSNSGELFVPLFGIIVGLPLPLLAIQILAIDLGTDVFPSLALGVEKEEGDVMKQPPYSQFEKIMDISMLWKLLGVGVVMGMMALAIYTITLYAGGWHWGEILLPDSKLYWMGTATVYTVLVFCQIANAFSCRSETDSIFKIGIFSNRWLLVAEVISAFLLWLVIGFPPLQNVFHTAWPNGLSWLLISASFFIFLTFVELWKKIFITKRST